MLKIIIIIILIIKFVWNIPPCPTTIQEMRFGLPKRCYMPSYQMPPPPPINYMPEWLFTEDDDIAPRRNAPPVNGHKMFKRSAQNLNMGVLRINADRIILKPKTTTQGPRFLSEGFYPFGDAPPMDLSGINSGYPSNPLAPKVSAVPIDNDQLLSLLKLAANQAQHADGHTKNIQYLPENTNIIEKYVQPDNGSNSLQSKSNSDMFKIRPGSYFNSNGSHLSSASHQSHFYFAPPGQQINLEKKVSAVPLNTNMLYAQNIPPQFTYPASGMPSAAYPFGFIPAGEMSPQIWSQKQILSKENLAASSSQRAIQPRAIPQDAMPPGLRSQENMPPGKITRGMMPQGVYQPATMSEGLYPPGFMPSGSVPPGVMPPGMLPPGMMPPGMMPPRNFPLIIMPFYKPREPTSKPILLEDDNSSDYQSDEEPWRIKRKEINKVSDNDEETEIQPFITFVSLNGKPLSQKLIAEQTDQFKKAFEESKKKKYVTNKPNEIKTTEKVTTHHTRKSDKRASKVTRKKI